jgi:hypothetical protein
MIAVGMPMTMRYIGLSIVPLLSRASLSCNAIMEIRQAAANPLRSSFRLSRNFGKGNFTALFEAIERVQTLRGHL